MKSSELSITTKDPNKIPILKLHGCISNPYSEESPLVISEDDYATNHGRKAGLLRSVESHKYSHTFIFVGYSFGDPDLSEIWTAVQNELGRLTQWAHALWPNYSKEQESLWKNRYVQLHDLTLSKFVNTLSNGLANICDQPVPKEGLSSLAGQGLLSLSSSVKSEKGKQIAEHTERIFDMDNEELQSKKELLEKYTRLRKIYHGMIHILTSTIEMVDPYTAAHQKRVAQLACAIAEKLNIAEEEIEGLRLAANVHDVGKITVPAEILSKPSKLTDAEHDLIKYHPQAGYEILKDADFPWPVADIVHQHHERLDGSGYPNGLSGDEIMLEARILAIADVVEAMVSPKPYRRGKSIDKVLEEINQNKDMLYDPQVVEACVKLFVEKRFQFNED